MRLVRAISLFAALTLSGCASTRTATSEDCAAVREQIDVAGGVGVPASEDWRRLTGFYVAPEHVDSAVRHLASMRGFLLASRHPHAVCRDNRVVGLFAHAPVQRAALHAFADWVGHCIALAAEPIEEAFAREVIEILARGSDDCLDGVVVAGRVSFVDLADLISVWHGSRVPPSPTTSVQQRERFGACTTAGAPADLLHGVFRYSFEQGDERPMSVRALSQAVSLGLFSDARVVRDYDEQQQINRAFAVVYDQCLTRGFGDLHSVAEACFSAQQLCATMVACDGPTIERLNRTPQP